MILKNATVLNSCFEPVRADLATSGERIAEIAPDLQGRMNTGRRSRRPFRLYARTRLCRYPYSCQHRGGHLRCQPGGAEAGGGLPGYQGGHLVLPYHHDGLQ